ncbi:MAG: SDR family NAD(P)-dependent oxidoreductase [Sphingomonadaceae bacterium]|nr:SDR family NAD(P)-dependent oxidoreductase [Sphingomonadaceae bacterium]
MRLEGSHAVVTGGGTGIGAAIAAALEAEGAVVSRVGRRPEKLGANGFAADVTDRPQVEAAFAAARAAHGPISILVNNAGEAGGIAFARLSAEKWRHQLAVNLDGIFHCCQAALADLRAAEAGRIVTIASTAGLRGYAYTAAYVAAKHGAVGLMRALAAEFAGTGLTANAICPGFTDTDLVAGAIANIQAKTGRSEAEAKAELARLNPSGRLIAPQEVAAVTLDLILSERSGEAVEIS